MTQAEQKTSRNRRNDRGMTLLEVALATLLLVMTFLGVAHLLTEGMKSTARSKVSTSTVTLAQQGLETVQSTSYDNIAAPANPDYLDQYGNVADPVTGTPYTSSDPRVRYVRTMTVKPLTSTEKEVTVTVSALQSIYGSTKASTSFTTRRLKFGSIGAGGSGS